MSLDDTCGDLNDFGANGYDTNVRLLTQQAKQLNPQLRVKGVPWSAPGWMKDNGRMDQIYPALRAAGLNTKVLVHDWNYGDYANFGSGILNDAGVRNDPLFGGIAWHGYFGDPAVGTQVRNQYPSVPQFSTEHSGGTWIANQHNEDLTDIISYARNHSGSLVKWSLALDQNMGPHNGGCGTCTGLITVQNGGARAGQVDYTVEYYTTGHLTKFVRPGAQRIETNDGTAVRNVAWRNTDGSKALIAHNGGTSAQAVKVNWGGQSFTYTLPARTTATFVWNGTASAPAGRTGAIAGSGKCLDVTDGSTADGNRPQIWTCYAGSANQTWTLPGDGTVRGLSKCLDVQNGATTDGAVVHLWTCYPGLASQQWTATAGRDLVNPASGKCLDVVGASTADGAKLHLWSCTGAANQKWTVPA